MAGKIYVAVSDGMTELEGQQVNIVAGITRVREGHALLRGREHMFRELRVQFEVEDARSAPQDAPKPQTAKAKAEEKAEAKDADEAESKVADKPAGLTSESTPGAKAPAARPHRGPRKA